MTGFQFPTGAMIGIFIFATASRPALGPVGVQGALTPRIKWPGREADHCPSSSAEVKNAWRYTSTSPYLFMSWCLIKHDVVLSYAQGQLYLYLYLYLNLEAVPWREKL
jgi:hypothetical protein